ncbi:hypothetical protein [Streptomyces sp. NPDC088358]|uniref:hypothetical protein n=1 Tax=Streptomyces sp. NPDC088358 TaxID=3365857 RepID=UPI0037F4DF2B
MKDNVSEEDRYSVLLVRDAMESTVAQLPSLHDLVPAALAQGRRRRARARLAIAAGSACVAGAVVAMSLTLSGGHGAHSGVRPAASGAPVPHESSGPTRPEGYRTPFHDVPINKAFLDGLTAGERTQRADFQQKAAVVLDELLPDSLGLVRPSDDDVWNFQGETADGKVFPLFFTVHSPRGGPGPIPCPGSIHKRGGSCEHVTLSNGTRATVLRLAVHPPEIMATRIEFFYGHSHVTLTVHPDSDAQADSPVTGKALQAIAVDSRFLDLVRDAIKLPTDRRDVTP